MGDREVRYDSKFLEEGAGVSSVVPIYINEVPDVDQTFFDWWLRDLVLWLASQYMAHFDSFHS